MKNVGGRCGSASPPGLAIVKNSISLPKHDNVSGTVRTRVQNKTHHKSGNQASLNDWLTSALQTSEFRVDRRGAANQGNTGAEVEDQPGCLELAT